LWLTIFSIFKDQENSAKGWFVELAIALVLPAWLSHFATAEGVGVLFYEEIFYSHFKLWLVVAPIQGVALIFLANAHDNREKPISTIFFVIFTSVAWAYCSWRGAELAASNNESSWAYMLFGMFIMTMPLIQFVIDISRHIKQLGLDNIWTRKLLLVFGVALISWSGFWIDWMIGAQGWDWNWYRGWPEVLFQAAIDLLATAVFGALLILFPPSSVLLPFNGENEAY